MSDAPRGIEREPLSRWLERHGTERQRVAFEREQGYRRDFIDLVQRYHRRLSDVYDSSLNAEAMRKRKNETIDDMLGDYGRLKEQWGGFTGYEPWFARRPNNAQIASVSIYTRLVPAFQALLRQEQNDLPRFYAAARQLAALPKDERAAALERLQRAALEAPAPIM